jgi:Protein of unknown function (DUF3168)
VATTIKERLYAAARLDAGLAALLGSGSPVVLRWFDIRLEQGTTFPAVVVTQISNPRTYAVSGRLPTGFSRIQFDVYGTGNDSQEADAIVTALAKFLDGFSGGTGVTGKSQYSNLIVADRDAGIAQTQPLTYRRIVDAQIFMNDLL